MNVQFCQWPIFMPKYCNFGNLSISQKLLPVEQKSAQFRPPGVEKEERMPSFWNFCQWPSFMPKYGNFENRSVSQKSLPVEQKYNTSFDPLGEKGSIRATCGTFVNHQISCPNMAIYILVPLIF